MKALEKNETWDMVELSKEKKTICGKWIFTIKYKVVDETIKSIIRPN